MDMFDYRGRNRRGELMRGSVESTSAQAVATWLMETEIYPISIRPRGSGPTQPQWLTRLMRQDKVHPQQVLLFTRQMANMVRSGVQMLEAVTGIEKNTDSPALAAVLRAVRADLDRGAPLSLALGRHPQVFDEYYVNMVRVGEGTGKLAEAFNALYDQLNFDRTMQQRMKASMRYPMFVVFALAVALTIVTIFVIPAFAKTYVNLKVTLPLVTRILLGLSAFVVAYWWAILLLVALAIYAARMSLRSPEIRYKWDRLKLHIPIIGPILSKATVARFARSFATAMKSDMPLVTAFQLVGRIVNNAYFEERVTQMCAGVERGELLSRVMATSGVFSPLELQLITVAERTGEVEVAVEQIAALYSEEVEYQMSRLSQTMEPLLLALMGVLVGVLVLGVFLPMWDLGQAHFRK